MWHAEYLIPACLKRARGVGALRNMALRVLGAPRSRAPEKEVCLLHKEKASLPFSPRHSVTTVKNLACIHPASHKALCANRCPYTPVYLFFTQRGSAFSSLKAGLTPVRF